MKLEEFLVIDEFYLYEFSYFIGSNNDKQVDIERVVQYIGEVPNSKMDEYDDSAMFKFKIIMSNIGSTTIGRLTWIRKSHLNRLTRI